MCTLSLVPALLCAGLVASLTFVATLPMLLLDRLSSYRYRVHPHVVLVLAMVIVALGVMMITLKQRIRRKGKRTQ